MQLSLSHLPLIFEYEKVQVKYDFGNQYAYINEDIE